MGSTDKKQNTLIFRPQYKLPDQEY
jgi:hypothetical protein